MEEYNGAYDRWKFDQKRGQLLHGDRGQKMKQIISVLIFFFIIGLGGGYENDALTTVQFAAGFLICFSLFIICQKGVSK